MTKFPPLEKIPEAYTAIEDNRIELMEGSAIVSNSDGTKEYSVRWKDGIYYSNDSATYWQGYTGYPVIAVLMLQGKLSLNRDISRYFSGINWKELNDKHKRDYSAALNEVTEDFSVSEKQMLRTELYKVMDEIRSLNIILTKKKNFE